MDREKEIKLLIYEENQVIRKSKKKIKDLNMELLELQGEKKLRRTYDNKRCKHKNKTNRK